MRPLTSTPLVVSSCISFAVRGISERFSSEYISIFFAPFNFAVTAQSHATEPPPMIATVPEHLYFLEFLRYSSE
ncbi:MAG: hypothetical protein ACD_47C00365G0001 [uncultured bacterium]|nr:MAG: hypothetical protein ACD_47C00365G0001 [uncultured bacterium]